MGIIGGVVEDDVDKGEHTILFERIQIALQHSKPFFFRHRFRIFKEVIINIILISNAIVALRRTIFLKWREMNRIISQFLRISQHILPPFHLPEASAQYSQETYLLEFH